MAGPEWDKVIAKMNPDKLASMGTALGMLTQ